MEKQTEQYYRTKYRLCNTDASANMDRFEDSFSQTETTLQTPRKRVREKSRESHYQHSKVELKKLKLNNNDWNFFDAVAKVEKEDKTTKEVAVNTKESRSPASVDSKNKENRSELIGDCSRKESKVARSTEAAETGSGGLSPLSDVNKEENSSKEEKSVKMQSEVVATTQTSPKATCNGVEGSPAKEVSFQEDDHFDWREDNGEDDKETVILDLSRYPCHPEALEDVNQSAKKTKRSKKMREYTRKSVGLSMWKKRTFPTAAKRKNSKKKKMPKTLAAILKEVCGLVKQIHDVDRIILGLMEDMEKDSKLADHFRKVIAVQQDSLETKMLRHKDAIVTGCDLLKAVCKNTKEVVAKISKRTSLSEKDVDDVISRCKSVQLPRAPRQESEDVRDVTVKCQSEEKPKEIEEKEKLVAQSAGDGSAMEALEDIAVVKEIQKKVKKETEVVPLMKVVVPEPPTLRKQFLPTSGRHAGVQHSIGQQVGYRNHPVVDSYSSNYAREYQNRGAVPMQNYSSERGATNYSRSAESFGNPTQIPSLLESCLTSVGNKSGVLPKLLPDGPASQSSGYPIPLLRMHIQPPRCPSSTRKKSGPLPTPQTVGSIFQLSNWMDSLFYGHDHPSTRYPTSISNLGGSDRSSAYRNYQHSQRNAPTGYSHYPVGSHWSQSSRYQPSFSNYEVCAARNTTAAGNGRKVTSLVPTRASTAAIGKRARNLQEKATTPANTRLPAKNYSSRAVVEQPSCGQVLAYSQEIAPAVAETTKSDHSSVPPKHSVQLNLSNSTSSSSNEDTGSLKEEKYQPSSTPISQSNVSRVEASQSPPKKEEVFDPTVPQRLTMRNQKLEGGGILNPEVESSKEEMVTKIEDVLRLVRKEREYVCANANCHESGVHVCGGCQSVIYCGVTCQTEHWNLIHREECLKLRKLHLEK